MDSNTMREAVTPRETIELLKSLVRIPSVNGCEEAVALWLNDLFQELGLETSLYEVEPHRPAVVGVLHGKRPGKRLMYTTHFDTHVTDNMEIPPFKPEIRENRLYGRGSCDAKGSIAAMIMSAVLLQRTGCDFSGDLLLAFVPDEEYMNKGTTELMKQGITADMAVVGEPTEMAVGFGHRGCTHIDINVTGRAYHSAFPERGINAIEHMAHVITALRSEYFPTYEQKHHPYLGHPVINLGLIRGGTRIHTVADKCCASFLRRDLPGETTEGILDGIQGFLDGLMARDPKLCAHASLSTIQQRIRLPFFMEPDHPLVSGLSESCRRAAGREGEKQVMNYYCDASILCTESGIPTVIFGPGSISVAHSAVEYIELDQLADAVYIYADYAMSLLAGEEKTP